MHSQSIATATPTTVTPVPDRDVAPVAPQPLGQRPERAQALAATVDHAIERLAAQLAEGHTAGFLAALAFWSRFHKYSWSNIILIHSQCPQATAVAGLRRWNELGYRVRPGEKAIWIWAPIVRKETDTLTGQEVEVVVGFRPAPVFEASQLANLDEKPMPALVRALPDDAEPVYAMAVARIEAAGIRVEERPLPSGVYGASQGGRIVVRAGLDSRTRLFVLLHELAHELAHQGAGQPEKPLPLRELEAEATAFVVAAILGLESVGARDYLLTYAVGTDELRAAMGTIQHLTRRVLAVVAPDERPARAAA